VAPGVLVTAWHVLDDIGAASDNSPVQVDPLAGGDSFAVAVARVDPVHDLAVLISDAGLPGTVGLLTPTDRMALRAAVTVTGHAVPDDPGHRYRFLNATGEWAGWTTRDDAVPLGRMTASAVVPGMSSAPVIRDDDGAPAGVVSGRYNNTDGWLAGTVWVARTEDLAVLLDGITEITMKQPPLTGPVDLLLTVTTDRVRLTGPGIEVTAEHNGVRSALVEAVHETRRSRAQISPPVRGPAETQVSAGELSLGRAARLLGESFLPEPIANELERHWQRRAGRISRSGSGWPCRQGWPGCRGRRCPARMAAARWPCTRWSACTARPTRRRGGCCRGRCGSWSRSPPPTPAGRCWITSGNCPTC
jgi:hypothetical protein